MSEQAPLTPEQIATARQEWALWHMGCVKDSLRYIRQVWGDGGLWDHHLIEAGKSLRRAQQQHNRHLLQQQQEEGGAHD